MLTRIQLENFKSWRELDMELAPITMLFGTNSSGKTAILQSLLLLKQTANSFDRKQHINLGGNKRDYVDFGSWRDLVSGHNENLEVVISWEFNFGVGTTFTDMSYKVSWCQPPSMDNILICRLIYGGHFDHDLRIFIDAVRQEDGRYLYVSSIPDSETKIVTEASPESCYILPYSEIFAYTTNNKRVYEHTQFHPSYTLFFDEILAQVNYLGPLRHVPKRSTVWPSVATNVIEPDGNNTISALIDAEQKGTELTREVSEWLLRMGLADSLQINPLDFDKRFYETKVRISDKGVYASLLDVGFGVSQILPVITLLFFAPEESIILLEQPELHLHPNAQSVLADLLLHVAEERKLQLIVESHSEHLLTRLQRRIAESDHAFASPENIKMYFCDIKDGESVAQPVEIDEYGQIKNWPENFFGDRGGDLDAMMEAALAKRRRELEGSG